MKWHPIEIPEEAEPELNGHAEHFSETVSLDDFYANMPTHSYIFAPTGAMWPAASVNARIPPITNGAKKISASLWLDQNRHVEQMTWAPGMPTIIRDKLIAEGGWIDRPGLQCFNLYRHQQFVAKIL